MHATSNRNPGLLALCPFNFVLALGLTAALIAPKASAAPDAGQQAPGRPAPAAEKAAAGQSNGPVQVAGELIVNLDARDPSAGWATWTNQGAMGNFTRIGAPKLATTGGQPAVQFNGRSDAYRSEKPAPPAITGDHPRSIEVWVCNPDFNSTEECMVAWGHRGATLNNLAFSYGSGGDFSAVTHYDDDMSWGEESPAPGQWHHLAYTYDGKTAKIYDNGVERGSRDFKLETAAGNRMNIAVENSAEGQPLFESEWDPNWPLSLSGSIAVVRVHSAALTAEQVKANFSANKARFGLATP